MVWPFDYWTGNRLADHSISGPLIKCYMVDHSFSGPEIKPCLENRPFDFRTLAFNLNSTRLIWYWDIDCIKTFALINSFFYTDALPWKFVTGLRTDRLQWWRWRWWSRYFRIRAYRRSSFTWRIKLWWRQLPLFLSPGCQHSPLHPLFAQGKIHDQSISSPEIEWHSISGPVIKWSIQNGRPPFYFRTWNSMSQKPFDHLTLGLNMAIGNPD